MEKKVSSTCTRSRRTRGLWSTGPSSHEPNGLRCSTTSGLLLSAIMPTVCKLSVPYRHTTPGVGQLGTVLPLALIGRVIGVSAG
ncbi:hypothetical protein GCM10009741_19550 [Kribbella lupini]|uniref:Uncharacterized protein n=1 Tax=Kribbella lupini TaxID=291602 RepID=A0ABN2AH65_9ACTN